MLQDSGEIAANLAEGYGRNGDAELARFCATARGSASELDSQLPLAKDPKLLNAIGYAGVARGTAEMKRILTGAIQRLTADR